MCLYGITSSLLNGITFEATNTTWCLNTSEKVDENFTQTTPTQPLSAKTSRGSGSAVEGTTETRSGRTTDVSIGLRDKQSLSQVTCASMPSGRTGCPSPTIGL